MIIRLNEYPDFRFDISDVAYSLTRKTIFAYAVHQNDSIQIDIKKDLYQKKISHEIPLSFFDKTIDYENISVYGIRSMNISYLGLQEYNQLNVKDNSSAILLLLYGLFSIGVGIQILALWRKSNN